MATMNESAWNEQDDLQNKTGYYTDNGASAVRNSAVDPDDDDDLDDDDLDDDDLDYDDEDFEDDDLDEDDLDNDLDEDEDGYNRVAGTQTTDISSGVANSYDADGNEIPEQGEADNESPGYTGGTEVEHQDRQDEASYSERNDVTPPNQHEFPDTGTHTQTDFASRSLGRTTGRMVGHEPGTESGNV